MMKTLNQIAKDIAQCQKCELCKERTNTVPGVCSVDRPSVVLIGEAPGEMEDITGEPFVGRAGQILNDTLSDIGLSREKIGIFNAVKCRPPGNRDPHISEINICKPYLFEQIYACRPKMVVCMGRIACRAILDEQIAVTKMNGKILPYRYEDDDSMFGVMITLHPSAILHNPTWKDDLQKAMVSLARVSIIHNNLKKIVSIRQVEDIPCIPMSQS